jgi:hypothetical protein
MVGKFTGSLKPSNSFSFTMRVMSYKLPHFPITLLFLSQIR